MLKVGQSSKHFHKLCSFLKRTYALRYFHGETKSVTSSDLSKIRNIGIIAHIDAGKTTTTERMLYYSGLTRMMGEVHDGDTVMDYMVQERERGITITSAAITFNWKKHRINLIDTPGHVDFTFEVERSLSVLDGAITILDSSVGVEVQTLKVWEQANSYEVPSIIYLNKLDKPAADVDMCLVSITNKLKSRPLLMHIPIGVGRHFIGVVDLLTLQKILWQNSSTKNDGRNFVIQELDMDSDKDLYLLACDKRAKLIENIADLDDEIAERYISNGSESLSVEDLQLAVCRISCKKLAVPVFCGSSYKNIGVQLLMDAILIYLPPPIEKKHSLVNIKKDNLCAVVFKIIHNNSKDALTFLRIYSGIIKSGQRLYNMKRDSSEKFGKLMIAQADNFNEVSSLSVGNIGVVSGLKHTVTGDVLFCSSAAAVEAKKDFENNKTSLIPCIHVPDPVFFCTVEPPSAGQQNRLEFALQCLQREDPTFRVEVDETIGQTILLGMGELHIDVIKERIRVEYGVDAYLGPLQVAYRETLEDKAQHTHILSKFVGGNKHYIKITIEVYPHITKDSFKEINVIVTKENDLGKVRTDYLKAINTGMKNGLNNGPLLNFPVINIGIDLLWLEVGKGTSLTMLSAATAQCIAAALRNSSMYLLEPIMSLSIAVNKGYAGRVLNDLSQKRSQILNMDLRQDIEIIHSRTPLSELRGYSTHLRALTSGTCSFTMEFDSYQRMSPDEQAKATQAVMGSLY